jgi:WD40 repeat protein
LRGHSARINDLIELSNGLLASASSDHQLNLWDPKRNFSCIYNVTNEDYQSVIYIRDFIKNNDLFLISVNSFGNIFVHILNKDNFPSFYKKLTNTTYAEKEKISDFTVLKSGFLVTSHKTIIRIYNLNEDFVLYKEINLEKFQEQKAKRKFGCDENNKNLCNDNYKENKKEKIEKNINENSYKNETNEKSMIIKHHSIQKLKQFKNGNIIVVTNLFLFVFNSITEMKLILKERFTGAYMGGGVFSHIQELESGYAAISSNDNTIKIFDPLKNYKLVFSLPTGSDNFITYLYELKNGLMIASTNCDLFIFNPNENFQIVLQIKDLTASRITGITELNSGYLAISSFDENIYILDRFHNFSLLRTVFIEKAQSIQNYLEIKNKK